MEADEGDDYIHLSDHGIFRDPRSLLIPNMNSIRGLWHKILTYGTVAEALAKSKKADSAAQISDDKENYNCLKRASRMAAIKDLQTPHNLPFAPLLIKDPQEYFDLMH
ncbi:hypothetical protein C5167_008356 [Papaver somniferum]|uniref:Uncharacterized protein n=1 Tax=Papaver somniferum TaxID=3469 RepID=A0A4Y7JUA6_PAPSO|nr:hypothetical protein C5167_008356 [Papaver somniferum]